MLSDCERDRLAAWHRRGLTDLEIADRMGDDWTRERVRYHRRRLRLPSNGYNRRDRVRERAAYATARGWLHLLPGVEYVQLEGRVKRYRLDLAGFDLTHRQVDALCLLRDRGPLTRDELGVPRHYRQWDNLGRLIALGLVERRLVRRGSRLVCLYGLTPAAGVPEHHARPNGADLRNNYRRSGLSP